MTSKRDTKKRYAGRGAIPKGLNPLLQTLNSLRKLKELPHMDSVTSNDLAEYLEKHKRLKSYLEKQEQAARTSTFKEEYRAARMLGYYVIFIEEANIVLDIIEKADESPAFIARYPTSYVKEAGGVFEISVNGVLRMLLNTEVDRLRRCPVCERFFWATRLDQKGCRKSCAEVLRKRRLRALAQERGDQYNAAKAKKKGKSK